MKSIEKQTSASRVANLTAAAVTLTLATLTACGSPVRHVRTAQPDAVATPSAGRGIPVGTLIPVVAVLDIASREGASERPGWMEVSFKSTTRADGTVVHLDDAPQRFEGKSRVKGSITLAVVTYGLGLLRTGGDVTLPEGTALVARVVE